MKKILLLIILSVFMITGCSSKETEIVDSKTNFTSYDELFTIEAEKKWQLAEKGKLNNNANLELIDENNNKYIGTYQKVLVEGESKNNSEIYQGRTSTNKVVIFDKNEKLIGIYIYNESGA